MSEYELTLSAEDKELSAALDGLAKTGLMCRDMEASFSKTILSARCMAKFKAALTDDVMDPIMSLQGSPIGFRTDKDKEGGYPLTVVREVIIAAAMMGLMPVGNMFNIIAGRLYVTKEGFMFLLSGIEGLVYDVEFGLPKQSQGGSVVHAHVVWSIKGGEKKSMDWDIPIRVNAGQGADAVLGKAMRKACAKLYNKITNSTLSDADVTEDEGAMKDVTPRWSGDVARERRAGAAAGSGLSAAVPPARPSRVVDAEVMPEELPAMDGRALRAHSHAEVDGLPEADGYPPDLEEQQAAALDWMLRVLRDSGKSWQDVYNVMKANGWSRPADGAPRSEMGAFSLWLFRDSDARKSLEMYGFILGK